MQNIFAWLVVGLCSGLACTPLMAMPQVEGSTVDQAVSEFIAQNYGQWIAVRKGWQPAAGSAIYQPCASMRIAAADGPRYLLAMCGDTEESVRDGMPGMDADATSGDIDLYVLKPTPDGKGLESVQSEENIDSGHGGMAGEVSIQRLGPHFYGFVIEESDAMQGYEQTMRRIYLPRDGKWLLAAPRINVSLNNEESVECGRDEHACEKLDFAMAPDTTSLADIYPLRVTETGSQGGEPISSSYTLTFDAKKGTYVVPTAVSEGY